MKFDQLSGKSQSELYEFLEKLSSFETEAELGDRTETGAEMQRNVFIIGDKAVLMPVNGWEQEQEIEVVQINVPVEMTNEVIDDLRKNLNPELFEGVIDITPVTNIPVDIWWAIGYNEKPKTTLDKYSCSNQETIDKFMGEALMLNDWGNISKIYQKVMSVGGGYIGAGDEMVDGFLDAFGRADLSIAVPKLAEMIETVLALNSID